MSIIGVQYSFAQEEGVCAPQNYKNIVKNAGAVFTGTVISKESLDTPYQNNVHFKINELVFGDYTNFVNVATSERRSIGSEFTGGDPFEIGKKYVVFAMPFINGTLYADSSGCNNSIVIPLELGFFGQGSYCSASVHTECLDRCGIDNWYLEKEPSCLSLCYDRNSNQCQLKPEPILKQEENQIQEIGLHLSPIKQISSGVLPENVNCIEGLKLIFKSTNGLPVCVKPESIPKLIERGWANLITTPIKDTSIYDEKFPAHDFSYQKIIEKLEKNERVSVLVILNTEKVPFDFTKANLELKAKVVSELQDIVLSGLPDSPDSKVKKFKYVPGFVITLDKAILDYLVNSPYVRTFEENKELAPG